MTLHKSVVLLLLLITGIISKAQVINEDSLTKKLDMYLVSAVRADKFNGTALIAQNGKIVLEKGYGFKNIADSSINDENTIFQIGSLTKPFTAAVILKLKEDSKISVNDKLSKYFPQQKDADKITIQELLNHTSGINNYTDVIGPEDSAIVSRPVARQRILDIFVNKPLAFKPSTKFEYCNSDYFLLGLIIEKVSGMTYEMAVRHYLFEPLEMDRSGFDYINLHGPAKAVGYVTFNTNSHIPAVKWDSTVTYAAGAMYSNAGDLYKWYTAIAKKQILSAATWREAFKPGLDNYGDGWWINQLYGDTCIMHSGGMPGFMSNFYYFPEKDITIILLNNFGNYGESLNLISNSLAAILFNKAYSLWAVNKAININEAVLKQFTGTYTTDNKVKVYITIKNGQLYAESSSKNGIPKLPIYPESQNEFFLKDFNAVFTFMKDVNLNVSGIITHENGKDIVFRKIK